MPSVIVSKPNKALAVPRTEGIMRLFPDGKPLDKLWVIKHGMAEYLLLSRLGFRLPNPVNCYYDWAGGSPFSVQRITCDLLTRSPRAYVLNDMGTGKTRSALWAWDYLRGNGYCGKLIVVAPLSTLWLVWGHEVRSALPHRKVEILHGTKKKRLGRLANADAEVYVINHDGIKVLLPELKQRKDIDTLVIDELATYRNNNDRSKTMLKFAEGMKFVWGLTGSPMPNEPTDVWMQCKIITPHTVPKYQSHARDTLMWKKGEFLWIPKPDAVEKAYSWMQPAVRFTLDDVVELPELITRPIDVPVTPQQVKVYTSVAREFLAMVEGHEINAANAAVAVNKLLQISGGYVYSSADGSVLKLDVDPRKEMTRDLILQARGKVLVFFPFKHMVHGVSESLTGQEIPHAVITGDTPTGERNEIFKDFQPASDQNLYKALLAHPRCMSHGLTLTAADTIIWYCPMPDLEVYEQANARITRVGQKHRQQIFHLQSTPVEKRVYKLLEKKASIQDKLLALFEDATIAAVEAA